MSNQTLAKRVENLEATLFDIKLKLADKHGIKHVDWIYHLLSHDQSLKAADKKQLASNIVFALFQQYGDELLGTRPEEFNIIGNDYGMSVTHKDKVVIRGGWAILPGSNALVSLKSVLDSVVGAVQRQAREG